MKSTSRYFALILGLLLFPGLLRASEEAEEAAAFRSSPKGRRSSSGKSI